MVVLVDNLSFSRRRARRSWTSRSHAFGADVRVVSENYLDVMRIPVVRGPSFNESDRAGQPRSVLINETMARTAFAGHFMREGRRMRRVTAILSVAPRRCSPRLHRRRPRGAQPRERRVRRGTPAAAAPPDGSPLGRRDQRAAFRRDEGLDPRLGAVRRSHLYRDEGPLTSLTRRRAACGYEEAPVKRTLEMSGTLFDSVQIRRDGRGRRNYAARVPPA
jgi:hypothetical protein